MSDIQDTTKSPFDKWKEKIESKSGFLLKVAIVND